VYQCPVSAACPEVAQPYACQNLGDWAAIPHADTCADWDGRPPEPRRGLCEATAPEGPALLYTGPDPSDPTALVQPDGRRLKPAGAAWVFDEPELFAGMTSAVVSIPGTSLAITIDTGYGDHVVRLIDTDLLGAGQSPVLGYVKHENPSTLNWGAVFVPPDRTYVATADGVVQAYSMDAAARTITRRDDLSISLPAGEKSERWYASGLAVSADGKRLAVSPVAEEDLLVFDAEATSATYGALVARADLEDYETFGVYFDPADPTGQFAYVTLWQGKRLLEVDLSDPAEAHVSRAFTTDKDPEGVAFLDERWLVVANGFGDTLSLVDRVSGEVTSVPVDTATTLHGTEPSTLAFDAEKQRLYVTLAGLSAVGAYAVDLAATPPELAPLGRLPTLWWPSGLALQDDGSLVVASLRGDGTGPSDSPHTFDTDDGYTRLSGGIQRIPAPTEAELAAGDAMVRANVAVGAQEGYPEVVCPEGADDFPIPATNTEGPSAVIDRVIIIVRENKTFDSIFGDLPGARGKADLLLKPDPAEAAEIWRNARRLAERFSISDNFYTSAEISSLGHVWTTYGRSSDYNERTWAMAGYGRSARPSDIQNGGVADVGRPEEGSLFDWLARAGIPHDILGEGVGLPSVTVPGHPPTDFKYPGGFIQSIGYPDVEKSCYLAGRARVRCDLGSVVYMTLTNDHTLGVSPTAPTPEAMCAVNDEATGMVVSALSKSPHWPSTLVLLTEDDPAQGGDHVDAHRTIFVAASPWVKRGYISKTHLDVPSLHKLIAHVYGLPYPNLMVEHAPLPLDMFTSTPDYAPFDYEPRTWPAECGDGASDAEAKKTEGWDTMDVDRSPGLDAQVTRWMRQRPRIRPRELAR
jgi:DNA-binding beta-propeller fold protein YncE